MITTLVFDFSRVILFPKDENYKGKLNPLHKRLSQAAGYNLLDHFELNEPILRYVQEFKGKYGLYIFTSGSIQNAPEIRPRLEEIFDGIYSSEELGVSKKDPNGYLHFAKTIGINPGEMIFIDDTSINVEAARRAGIESICYVSLDQLKTDLGALLN
ncbi:MAG TPA: HAD-IA family hydrolase [Candidatus Nanoarchaeia archaeon]|nr:HAD-IA family hydrolase [Candidatus Nanoarchaeia archaeon]